MLLAVSNMVLENVWFDDMMLGGGDDDRMKYSLREGDAFSRVRNAELPDWAVIETRK